MSDRKSVASHRHHRTGYAPEELFSQIERTKADRFEKLVEAKPRDTISSYVIFSLALVMMATIGQLTSGTTVWSDALPPMSSLPLVLGLAFFPLKMFWLPLLVFIGGLVFSIGFRATLDIDYIPPDTLHLLLVSVAGYGAAASLAGISGKLFHRFAVERGYDRKADILSLVVTGLAVPIMGGAATEALDLWPAMHEVLVNQSLNGDMSVYTLTIIRLVKLGAASGLFLMLFYGEFASEKVRLVGLGVVVAVIMALLNKINVQLVPSLDIFVPLFALVLVLRAHDGVVLSCTTLFVYEVLTQGLSGHQPGSLHESHGIDIYGAFALVLLFGISASRFVSFQEVERSKNAVQRLDKVHDFAKVGYFVVDPEKRIAYLDNIGAAMLGTKSTFDIEPWMARVDPSEVPFIVDALSDPLARSKHFSFHLSSGDSWSAEDNVRYISVFVWYEHDGNGDRVAYGAVVDLTQEDERERQLRNALNQIKDQQDKQTQLFSIVSHELRTPASLITMLIEEMSASRDWDSIEPKLKSVSEHLVSVLGDMRQAVRPDQNLPVSLVPVVPMEKLERLRNNFALLAQQNGFSLHINAGLDSAQARLVDRTRVHQAISNLIKNAILHSGGKNIYLSYREEGLSPKITGIWTIDDDGKGIPEALRDMLFQPFSRLESKRGHEVDGSGLGLYVVKSSIEFLGGGVTVSSRAGGGTRFEIRLPMPPAQTSASSPSGDSGENGLSDLSILVAEDSELMAELLTKRLTKVFKRVSLAKNGRDALDIQQRDPHDVLLTDLFMPEIAGDELTRLLRKGGFKGPIIGMTAAAIGEERTEFEKAGTDAVITKPVKMQDFFEILIGVRERTS